MALAQAFPSRNVTLVVPNPPGGAIDIQARIYAQKLQDLWGQPVMVDYKPGAGTLLGMEHVAKSAPDGHTLCLVVTPLVILPALREKMPYDTLKDLAPVTLTGVSSIMIAASPTLQAGNIAELIALAKKHPGKLTYASPGLGSSMHLAGELLKMEAGIDLLHVPFKGGAQAYPELMAGAHRPAARSDLRHLPPRQGRKDESHRVTEREARPLGAGSSRGSRNPSRVRRPQHQRHRRRRRHAARARTQDQRRLPQAAARARHREAARGARHRAGGQLARGVRRLHQERDRALDAGRQGREREDGVT